MAARKRLFSDFRVVGQNRFMTGDRLARLSLRFDAIYCIVASLGLAPTDNPRASQYPSLVSRALIDHSRWGVRSMTQWSFSGSCNISLSKVSEPLVG